MEHVLLSEEMNSSLRISVEIYIMNELNKLYIKEIIAILKQEC